MKNIKQITIGYRWNLYNKNNFALKDKIIKLKKGFEVILDGRLINWALPVLDKKSKILMLKEPTHRKFEWNCHGEKHTLEDKLISFRG